MAVYCFQPKDISSSRFQLVIRQLFINVVGDALQARDVLKKKDLENTLTSSGFGNHALCTGALASCELLLS